MITSWLKHRKAIKVAAAGLYQAAVDQSRDPKFYTDLGVADTMDGHFDMATIHVFLIMNRLRQEDAAGNAISQALFDHMFKHMDMTLREIGIGDMGVPKHMKRMMKAFNGRVHTYHAALNEKDLQTLKLAVARNIYRSEGSEIPDAAALMAEYISTSAEYLLQQDFDSFAAGRARFPALTQDSTKAYYA